MITIICLAALAAVSLAQDGYGIRPYGGYGYGGPAYGGRGHGIREEYRNFYRPGYNRGHGYNGGLAYNGGRGYNDNYNGGRGYNGVVGVRPYAGYGVYAPVYNRGYGSHLYGGYAPAYNRGYGSHLYGGYAPVYNRGYGSHLYGGYAPAYNRGYGGYGDGGYDRHNDYAQPTPYDFGYDVHGHEGDQQYRKESGDGHGNVQGSYGYRDAHGLYRQVDYVADHYGFRANVKTNEPGTANQNPADVHVQSEQGYNDRY